GPVPRSTAPQADPRAAPVGGRRGDRAVVRAVRHRPPRSHGLRRSGGRDRRGRPARHRAARTNRPAGPAPRPGRTGGRHRSAPGDTVAAALDGGGGGGRGWGGSWLGGAGASVVREHFTWQQVASSTLEIYQALVRQRPDTQWWAVA